MLTSFIFCFHDCFTYPLVCWQCRKIVLNPPSTATHWRVLRNQTGTFIDANSPDVVYAGIDRDYLDTTVDNGTVYFYKPFYFVNGAWDSSYPALSVTPNLAFMDVSPDPVSLVRDRLDAGLNALIVNGALSHPYNKLVVLTASPQTEDTLFPVVTVHLSDDRADDRGIGDLTDTFDDYDPNIFGWYSTVCLEIVGWCLNGDERLALRKAIKTTLISNLEVFNQAGLHQLTLTFSDSEDFESYHCPIYRTHCSLHCTVISAVQSTIVYPPATITSTMSTPYG